MKLILLSLSTALIVTAQAPADYSSATAYARTFQATLHRNIEKSAEKLPAEAFGFRPSHDVRTAGELFGHIANAEYNYCAIVAGEPNPNKISIEKEKEDQGRTHRIAQGGLYLLRESLRWCQR